MSTNLKLVSLNIQTNKHIPAVLSFLKNEDPDVICLQEIFQPDFELLTKELNLTGVFDSQLIFKDAGGAVHNQGVAVLSRCPILSHESIPYTNQIASLDPIETKTHSEKKENKNSANSQYARKVLFVKINKGEEEFVFANTHFTWAYYGYMNQVTDEFVWDIDEPSTTQQSEDATRLLEIFSNMGEFVFCADTNCPRGQKNFALFAEKLKDNIPEIYKTSIDGSLHRAGSLPLMVDVVFTTPTYTVTNVVLKDGVSDHMAVVCNISK